MATLLDDFLSVIDTLAPVAVLIALISAVVRSRRSTLSYAVGGGLVDSALAYSGLAVAFLVFSPQPQCPSTVEFELGDDLLLALQAHPGDLLPWMQLGGNCILLLPLSALVPLRVRWLNTLPKIVLAGFCVSCSIEIIQYLAIVGRTSSTDDVLLNTIGATLGGAIFRLLSLPGSPFRPTHSYRPQHERTIRHHVLAKTVLQPRFPRSRTTGPRHALHRPASRPRSFSRPRIYRNREMGRV